MKNLLIYLNPEGFDPESERMAKIQIDNSLDLGWDKNDILFITNFNFEHSGVKSLLVDNTLYCKFSKYASKIYVINYLFEKGIVDRNLFWFHDLDAFQNNIINSSEPELNSYDAGFTDYGRIPRWNTGSFFFKKSSKDIFELIRKGVDERGTNSPGTFFSEEHIFNELMDNDSQNINSRMKRLNITYNFGMRKIQMCFDKAIKPLRVLHFHPESTFLNTLAITMHGRNRIGIPLMSPRLIRIFKKHGYT